MEQTNDNGKGKNNRQKKQHPRTQSEKPQRRRRVSVDRDVEVVVVSNVIGRFIYENPRMSQIIDLHHIGDEEYITVGDLRTILNSHRKVLEGFNIIITEVLDSNYTLEDVLIFLGLDKKYEEFYSLARKKIGEQIGAEDIKNFVMNAPVNAFEMTMEKIDEKLRSRIIESAVVLFRLGDFGDYNKMKIIEKYVSEDLFADAQESAEVDKDVYI